MPRSQGGGAAKAAKGKRKRGATNAGGSAGGDPQPASPPFDHMQAITLYNTEKYEECVALCREGVQAGDAKAQHLLGRCHMYRRGVDKDQEEAARLFRLSAAQNEPLGMWQLGVCHQYGYGGVEKSDAKAVEQYRLSAAHGCAEGQGALAYMHEHGTGVGPDIAEATRLRKMAAQQGQGAAMRNLGITSTDQAEKMKWYFKAAKTAPHQMMSKYRNVSVAESATAAHALTNPSTGNHAKFVAAIKSIADAAIADTTAKFAQTAHLGAMLNQQRLEHDPATITAIATAPADGPTYGCDVALKAGDMLFSCHRIILAAASGMLQTKFDGDFEDAKAPVVPMVDCTPELAERLITHMYTGQIEFASVLDACAVMERAQYYQIEHLIKACAVYLEPRVGALNSMLVEAVALGQQCEALVTVARRCTAGNFALATTGEMFLDCSLGALKSKLADESVHGASEDAVLEAVLRWVEHDQANRGAHLEVLLTSVRLDKITDACFQYAVASPAVRAHVSAFMKLTDGFATRGKQSYSPADGGRASKRPRTS